MPRSASLAPAALALVLMVTACGSAAPSTGVSAAPANPAVAAQGRQVFATSCSACHGLTGAESSRRQGGDLAAFAMTEAQIASETRIMPTRRPLSAAQVRAVSLYVLAVQRAYRRRAAGHHTSAAARSPERTAPSM